MTTRLILLSCVLLLNFVSGLCLNFKLYLYNVYFYNGNVYLHMAVVKLNNKPQRKITLNKYNILNDSW